MDEAVSNLKLRKFTKYLLELETSSLTNFSAPDSNAGRTSLNFQPTRHGEVAFGYKDLHLNWRHRRHKDNLGIHIDPSFQNLIPYRVLCYDRILKARKKYYVNFEKELNNLIDNQPNALEGIKLYRTMSYTTLWPLYHTHNEIDYSNKIKNIHFTSEQKKRLEYLKNTRII